MRRYRSAPACVIVPKHNVNAVVYETSDCCAVGDEPAECYSFGVGEGGWRDDEGGVRCEV